MKLRNILLGLILTISIISAQENNSQKNNQITWQIIDWPPFMTISDNKIQGQYAKLLELIETNLPEYKHNRKKMSWARVWHEIKYNKNTCNIFAFKNPQREEFTSFSIPFSIFSSNHIIMKKTKARALNIDITKSYSLKELFNTKSIKGILDKSRSYSSKIDTIIKENEHKSNFKKQTFTAPRLLKLLNMGRIDYILEYPSIINKLSENITLKEELVYIRIKEINPFTWGHIACPKNEWGERLIDKINTVISNNSNKKEYRQIIEIMASSENELNLMREIYPKFIAKPNN